MGFRKSPRSVAEEVDEYLPSQDAPVYVAAAASSENAMEERERGRGSEGAAGSGLSWGTGVASEKKSTSERSVEKEAPPGSGGTGAYRTARDRSAARRRVGMCRRDGGSG